MSDAPARTMAEAMSESIQDRHRGGVLVANVSLAANVVLAGLKTAIGIIGHSPALLADGINSTSDVAYLIVVRIFMGQAGKPADDEHPYGHTQLESIAALVVGCFVITTGIAIFWDAVNKVYDILAGRGEGIGASQIALYVALFTVLIKIVLTGFSFRVARRTGNVAVNALACDHRNDIFSASGAAVGIVLGRIGYMWADPLAGALVALLVLKTGVGILQDSSANLMDTVPGKQLDQQVRQALAGVVGLVTIEEVQAHRFGPYLVMNVTVGVDGGITVAAGDAIASEIEQILARDIPFVLRVFVHYHPAKTGE